MRWQRSKWPILLALFAALTPAGFLAAATRTTDISFSATNVTVFTGTPAIPPVDPLTGSFTFECSTSPCSDPDFTGTLGNSDTGAPPTSVNVNFDAFTTANVGGRLVFSSGALTSFEVGGTVNMISGLNGDTDDFVLSPGQVLYKAVGTPDTIFGSTGTDLTVQSETRVSGS
jgi:hypothetical protein